MLYKFLFTFLKIKGLVIYDFPILVLGLIFDRGGTPLLIFLLDSMILVLALRDFCSFSREEGGRGCSIPPHQGELFIQWESG